jgi:hypothetical protein
VFGSLIEFAIVNYVGSSGQLDPSRHTILSSSVTEAKQRALAQHTSVEQMLKAPAKHHGFPSEAPIELQMRPRHLQPMTSLPSPLQRIDSLTKVAIYYF